jgi:hypothetical protein
MQNDAHIPAPAAAVEPASSAAVATAAPFAAARFIKEIGRGKDGARSLSREDAQRCTRPCSMAA